MPSIETKEKLKASPETAASEESSLEAPLKDHESDSVYDFIYHDARRIASFISQFQEYGHDVGVKAGVATKQTGTTNTGGSMGASIPLVGNARGSLAYIKQDENNDTLERSFDPLWRNALTLLNHLTSAELLVKEAAAARIGQLVQITGKIAIFNTGMMKTILSNNVLKKFALGNILKGVHKDLGVSPSQHKEMINGLLEFIGNLAPVTQIGIETPSDIFWGILSEDNMITSATDILYKNSGSPPGTWHTIGVLDALPDDKETDLGMSLGLLGGIGDMFKEFTSPVRGMVGRPKAAYGITPLLVMREVSSAQSDLIKG